MGSTQRKIGGTRPNNTEKGRTPHKSYMKLASLELERARHLQERMSLISRLQGIEDRLRAIETEQGQLVGGLPAGVTAAVESRPLTAAAPGSTPGLPAEQPNLSTFSGFKSEEAGSGRLRFRY
jgi:hypothetical protein